jgi:hypothetical protein
MHEITGCRCLLEGRRADSITDEHRFTICVSNLPSRGDEGPCRERRSRGTDEKTPIRGAGQRDAQTHGSGDQATDTEAA